MFPRKSIFYVCIALIFTPSYPWSDSDDTWARCAQGQIRDGGESNSNQGGSGTLQVVASPDSYGAPYGSGAYAIGSTASASIEPFYGYEFKRWSDTSGTQNPREVKITGDTTLVGLLDRRLFAVTLNTRAFAGGGAWGASWANYSAATANVYNASTGQFLAQFVSTAQNTTGVDAWSSAVHTLWVPYGDTVYFDGYAAVHSVHMGVVWSGYSQVIDFGSLQWYAQEYLNVSRVQVLGDTTLGYFGVGTPIMIDLSREGKPDLLAGSQWRKTKERRPSGKLDVYRSFDLDGTGEKRWEWIGKNDGLLVYTADLKGTPTYKDLFGTRTFGKTWRDGYEALATLDSDRNGLLQGSELMNLGVWVDSNSDAVAQSGEIRSAKDVGVTEISVAFEADADGNVWSVRGAKLGGRDVATWDWISYAFPETNAENEVARIDWTNKAPPTGDLKVNAEKGMEAIKMLPGGTLRVHRINGQLYVRATAKVEEKSDKVLDVLYAAEVTSDGLLRWGIAGVNNTLLASGPDLYGLTLVGKEKYGLWSAKLISGRITGLLENRSQ